MKIWKTSENISANIEYSSASGNKLEKAHSSDAGYDIQTNCSQDVVIGPGETKALDTGIRLKLPKGWEAQIRSRSGLAKKFGVIVANSLGTIDPDYRGEVKVLLLNTGKESYTVKKNDKIAQVVFSPVWNTYLEMIKDSEIDKETTRGEKGFGSTEEKDKEKKS